MYEWTEERLIKRLSEGFGLAGDCGSDVPFGLFEIRGDDTFGSRPTVPADLVLKLFDKGIIGPCSPGKVVLYKLKSDVPVD